jgi:predicted nucleic acid-binding protein
VIAVDTSSWIAFLSGAPGTDVHLVEEALAEKQACLPPVTLTELLSDPRLPDRVAGFLMELPRLALTDGYWERAGALRATLVASRRKAPLADTLIAQSCLDHGVRLITRDSDFRHFGVVAGLLVLP